MKRRKTAELHLPIFKQGDDLGACLRQHRSTRKALIAYSEKLAAAQAIVLALAEHGRQLEITQADTHFIEIEGPSSLPMTPETSGFKNGISQRNRKP